MTEFPREKAYWTFLQKYPKEEKNLKKRLDTLFSEQIFKDPFGADIGDIATEYSASKELNEEFGETEGGSVFVLDFKSEEKNLDKRYKIGLVDVRMNDEYVDQLLPNKEGKSSTFEEILRKKYKSQKK